MLQKWLQRKFRRKEWTANPADPTVVIQWRSRNLTLVAIWEVEANINILGFKFRFYNNCLFNWFYGYLEDAYNQEQYGRYDPKIEAAERKAGWDPNP